MALPYQLEVKCVAINPNHGTPVTDPDDFAYIVFEKHADETAADEIQEAFQGGPEGQLIVRVHQAQKDDFTVGNKYTLSIQ